MRRAATRPSAQQRRREWVACATPNKAAPSVARSETLSIVSARLLPVLVGAATAFEPEVRRQRR